MSSGYTNIPNAFFDWQIDNKELNRATRILALVARYTLCFHREYHELSLSFMAERLDIRRDHISEEIKKMIDSGLLRYYMTGQKRYLAIGYAVPGFGNSAVPESRNSTVPENGNQEIKNNKLKKDISSEFEMFWIQYPRKDAKADAAKAFSAAIKKAPLEIILDGCKGYATQIERDQTEKKFVKLAGGWLRSERWVDYQPKETKSKLLRLIELHSAKG